MSKQKDIDVEEPIVILPMELDCLHENEYNDSDNDIDEPLKIEEEPDYLPLYEIIRNFNLETGVPIGDKLTLFKLSEFMDSM